MFKILSLKKIMADRASDRIMRLNQQIDDSYTKQFTVANPFVKHYIHWLEQELTNSYLSETEASIWYADVYDTHYTDCIEVYRNGRYLISHHVDAFQDVVQSFFPKLRLVVDVKSTMNQYETLNVKTYLRSEDD